MNENKHTPEPWNTDAKSGFHCDIHDGLNDDMICRTFDDPTDELNGEANARRIVACVNACAGIGTEYLEHFGATTFNDFKRVKHQRDELLAALEDAATSLETIQLRSYGEESYLDSKQQMRGYAGSRAGVAREVIASVKGINPVVKESLTTETTAPAIVFYPAGSLGEEVHP